jgi:hypothetical protein
MALLFLRTKSRSMRASRQAALLPQMRKSMRASRNLTGFRIWLMTKDRARKLVSFQESNLIMSHSSNLQNGVCSKVQFKENKQPTKRWYSFWVHPQKASLSQVRELKKMINCRRRWQSFPNSWIFDRQQSTRKTKRLRILRNWRKPEMLSSRFLTKKFTNLILNRKFPSIWLSKSKKKSTDSANLEPRRYSMGCLLIWQSSKQLSMTSDSRSRLCKENQ